MRLVRDGGGFVGCYGGVGRDGVVVVMEVRGGATGCLVVGQWFGDEMVLTMVGLVVMAERELVRQFGNGIELGFFASSS